MGLEQGEKMDVRLNVVLRSSAIAAITATLGACSTITSSERTALDTGIGNTLDRCTALPECDEARGRAYGMLVLPEVSKGALVLGGAYGDGGLVENGKTTKYYSLAGASIGLQLGYRESALVLMFMTPSALANFKEISGWDARRNFAVTAGRSGDDWERVGGTTVGLIEGAPAYVFVVGNDGLMFDASWNGLKLTHMTPEP